MLCACHVQGFCFSQSSERGVIAVRRVLAVGGLLSLPWQLVSTVEWVGIIDYLLCIEYQVLSVCYVKTLVKHNSDPFY